MSELLIATDFILCLHIAKVDDDDGLVYRSMRAL